MRIIRNIYLILCTISISIFPVVLQGQSKSFDERYEEVYLNIIATDVNEAIRIADSLIAVSKNDLQSMKAMMLSANIYHSLGNLPLAINYILDAQAVSNAGKHAEWQARTSGFLASIFRSVGLMEESKKHIKQAEVANEKQKNSPGYFLTKTNIHQEMAFHAIHDSAFHEALDHLDKGAKYIKKDSANHAQALLVVAINDQIKAVCHLDIGELDLADSLLNTSLKKLHGEESNLLPYIYRAKAKLALARQQHDSTYHYLQLATPYIESSQREELKELLYKSFFEYYRAIGNNGEAVLYYEKYRKIFSERERTARIISNDLIKRLSEENQRYYTSLQQGWWYLGGIVLVMIGVFVVLFFKRRKEKKAYIMLINMLQEKNNARTPVVSNQKNGSPTQSKTQEEPKDEPKLLISEDTEKRLIDELESLERADFYLDKDMSLSSLANQLNTNQRYISYTVRKYKGMDFITYIHHCRIHYVINRLKNKPELLDYKLSYLAEISGFSSHSKFSAIFKSVTGISPSVFVQYTKREKDKS